MNIFCYVESPIGRLTLTSDGTALTGLYMGTPSKRPSFGRDWAQNGTAGPLPMAVHQLKEYFAGKAAQVRFAHAPAGTEFQRRVWNN